MPQISLYIDEPTLRKIEYAAERQHLSLSKWVAEQLRTRLEPVYPPGYEELFGSIADDSFVRPRQHGFSADTRRESF